MSMSFLGSECELIDELDLLLFFCLHIFAEGIFTIVVVVKFLLMKMHFITKTHYSICRIENLVFFFPALFAKKPFISQNLSLPLNKKEEKILVSSEHLSCVRGNLVFLRSLWIPWKVFWRRNKGWTFCH